MTMTGVVNFVTPINKIFNGPLKGVYLVHNSDGDLSLYRGNEHVWSAGRLKGPISDVQWSPKGVSFIAVRSERKPNCWFLFNSEDGKRLNVHSRREPASFASDHPCLLRWLVLDSSSIILATIDCGLEGFKVNWRVNCEFELVESKLPVSVDDGLIVDVRVDEESQDILIVQEQKNTIDGEKGGVEFKFTLTTLSSPFKQSPCTSSISTLAKLSKHLQVLFRSTEELKEKFSKLLKFEDGIYERIREDQLVENLRKFLLFGNGVEHQESLFLKESQVFDWKGRLKKQHSELLVSFEEVFSLLKAFRDNFGEFSRIEFDAFLHQFLPNLEEQGRRIQHDVAEFLLWLENTAISLSQSQGVVEVGGGGVIEKYPSERRAIEISKALKGNEEQRLERIKASRDPFDDFKSQIEAKFGETIKEINSLVLGQRDALCIKRFTGPEAYRAILPFDLCLFGETRIMSLKYEKKKEILCLPSAYMTHYMSSVDELIVICEDLKRIKITRLSDGEIEMTQDFDDCGGGIKAKTRFYGSDGLNNHQLIMLSPENETITIKCT